MEKNNKTEVLEVRITPEMDKEFKAVVQKQGLTESEVVRGLVEGYIRKHEVSPINASPINVSDAIKGVQLTDAVRFINEEGKNIVDLINQSDKNGE